MLLDEINDKAQGEIELIEIEASLDVVAAFAKWHLVLYKRPITPAEATTLFTLIDKAIEKWPTSVERANLLAYRIGKAAFYMPSSPKLIDELHRVPETLDRVQIEWAIENLEMSVNALPYPF